MATGDDTHKCSGLAMAARHDPAHELNPFIGAVSQQGANMAVRDCHVYSPEYNRLAGAARDRWLGARQQLTERDNGCTCAQRIQLLGLWVAASLVSPAALPLWQPWSPIMYLSALLPFGSVRSCTARFSCRNRAAMQLCTAFGSDSVRFPSYRSALG